MYGYFRFFENFGNQKQLNSTQKSLQGKTEDARVIIEVSGNIYETYESTLNQFPGYLNTNMRWLKIEILALTRGLNEFRLRIIVFRSISYAHELILDTLLGDPERRKEYFDENSKFYIFDRNRNAFSSILLFYQSKEGFQDIAGSLNI